MMTRSNLDELDRLRAENKLLRDELARMCELYDAMGAPRGPTRILADAALEKTLVAALKETP